MYGAMVSNICGSFVCTVPNAQAVSHMGLGLTMVPQLANCFLRHKGYTATGYPALTRDPPP